MLAYAQCYCHTDLNYHPLYLYSIAHMISSVRYLQFSLTHSHFLSLSLSLSLSLYLCFSLSLSFPATTHPSLCTASHLPQSLDLMRVNLIVLVAI